MKNSMLVIKSKISFLLLLVVFTSVFSFRINAQSTPDPGLPGAFAVSVGNYNLGDLAYLCPSAPDSVEVRGSVHYPTLLSSGPFPVIMLLHGRHETCYETANPGNTSQNWPCAANEQSITSFEGYDYFAQQMASHGYIVISISCNSINAHDAGYSDYGMAARAELVQHHLDLWNMYNTTGGAPFGTTFVGKLDMTNIGTMGHSRGGEGVIANALLNRSLGSPYGIKAVLTLAPVDFLRHVLNDIPIMNIAPYCDGDVSDLQGVHYYDDSRYVSADETPKHSVLMLGANHNFFNTVWTPGLYPAGGVDDWQAYVGGSDAYCSTTNASNQRLTPTNQQAAFNAYASAFFRIYLGHETVFAPILKVEDIVPPTSSTLDSSNVFVSYHPPASQRLDINRTTLSSNINSNTLADTVAGNSLNPFTICGGGLGMTSCGISTHFDQEPHRGTSGTAGLAQQNFGWNSSTDYYVNELPPANQNIAAYSYLQFRTSVNFAASPLNVAQNFTVQLIDNTGAVSSTLVNSHSHALFYQPGTQFSELPKIVYNTVKIPLSSFTGVDMTNIKKIKLLFNQTTTGAALVTDIALSGYNPLTTSIVSNSFSSVSVYPNPATSTVTIDFQDSRIKNIDAKIKIYSLLGELLYQSAISNAQSTVDLSAFAKGVYILNISNNGGSKNYKIVKQ